MSEENKIVSTVTSEDILKAQIGILNNRIKVLEDTVIELSKIARKYEKIVKNK